jgi:outer membrane receptor protein involved in Fe transport
MAYKTSLFTSAFATTVALTLINGSVSAQDEPAYADVDEDAVEEIIVTGSRLRRRDFNAPSPITSMDQVQIRNTGQANLEAALNKMPQVAPSITRSTNNGSNGTADVNLRGFGSGRTLVMLNGRRIAASGIGSAVDINSLPQVLIDRVEIITGGATTVYGSDAVSGVVNFITRTDFDGFGINASAYMTERGDSNTYDINLTYGHNFSNGRGNLTLFAGYLDREELLADQRELTSVPWVDAYWEPEPGLTQGGSTRVSEGAIVFPEFDYGNGPAMTIFDPDGDPREFIDPDDRYNWAPWNYIQTPLERYSAGFFLNYELTDRTELYAEASYTHNQHRAVLAPVPAGGFFEFNTDNPLMTPATQQLFETFNPVGPNRVGASMRRRFDEFGPRIIENEKKNLRIVTGIKGEIRNDWEFDAWLSYTDSDEPETLYNDGSRSRFQQGLLVDPVTGQCFDPSNGCVPVNWFGAGNLSPEAVDFVRLPPLENRAKREQLLASAFVRGKLFDTWDGAVESAFGVEWRRDDGSFFADDYLFTNDTLGYRADASVFGTEEVVEVFGEMLVPLADTRPFADFLALELGARYSDYKNAGDSETWKAGFDWRPISSLRFRGMFQRSVRAPNLLEAFQEQGSELGTFANFPEDDPCSVESDPVGAGNVEKCIATGLPADQIGVFSASPTETTYLFGGNPALVPEEADTLTLGVVIAPEAWPNLQVAVDYFELELEGSIGDLNARSACFDSANNGNIFCDRMTRDPISYNVSEINETNINRGASRTTGFDTQVNVGFELPGALAIGDSFADLDVDVIWTHVSELSTQQTVFGSKLECAGFYGWPCWEDTSTHPKDRVTTNFSYASGDLMINLTWQWIDKVDNAAPKASGDFGFPDPELAIPYVKQKNYLDLGISYRFSDNIEAHLMVANLTDTEAPLMADQVWDQNTDTSMYDIYGRSYTLAFSLNY